MTTEIPVPDDLAERIDSHLEEGETRAEFIEELVSMYETEGAFLQEGYSE
ncbi:MAG: YlcI/YnfO family protein [Salinirussus sp.]